MARYSVSVTTKDKDINQRRVRTTSPHTDWVPMSKLTTCIIDNEVDFEAIRADWDRLWQQMQAPVYLHWQWIAAVFTAYGDDRSHCHVVVKDDDRVVGILPASIQHGSLIAAGAPRSDMSGILCETNMAAMIVGPALSRLLNGDVAWNTATFDLISQDGLLTKTVSNCDARTLGQIGNPLVTYRAIAPFLSLFGDKDEMIRKCAWKKTPRRQRNRLAKQGTLVAKVDNSVEEMHQLAPEFIDFHVKRRASCGDESFLADADGRRFLSEIIDRLGTEGLFSIDLLTCGEANVAMCLSFRAHGTCFYYAPTFNDEWSSFTPGNVLLGYLIEDAIQRDFHTFDFGQGDEEYKSRFATGEDHLYALHLFRRGIAPQASRVQLALKERLRDYPRLYSQLKWLTGK